MEGTTAVFVGNLPWTTTEEQLKLFFLQVEGNALVGVEIKRHEDTKRSKGWGLVTYSTLKAANRVIEAFNSIEMNGRKLHLRLDRNIEENVIESQYPVYVGNLAWQIDDNQLRDIFAGYSFQSCNVMTNMYGCSRGYAIIKFNDENEAMRLIENFSQAVIHGRVVECRVDRGPGKINESNKKSSLYVGKLDVEMDDVALESLFAHLGPIENVKIQRNGEGVSRGWGIVKFVNPDDAKKAIDYLANSLVNSEGVPFEIRYDRK